MSKENKTTRFADRILEFFKSRAGLCMLLALQIFILKTTRPKHLAVAAAALIIIGHIIGMHAGICPLKDLKPCQFFTRMFFEI